MLISIKEYAERNGLRHDNVRHKCQRGSYKTAKKIGRDWLIDENEKDADHRIKTGAYVGKVRKSAKTE
jgi:hypothetical protein